MVIRSFFLQSLVTINYLPKASLGHPDCGWQPGSIIKSLFGTNIHPDLARIRTNKVFGLATEKLEQKFREVECQRSVIIILESNGLRIKWGTLALRTLFHSIQHSVAPARTNCPGRWYHIPIQDPKTQF